MHAKCGFSLALLLAALTLPCDVRAEPVPALPAGVRLVLARCDGVVQRQKLLEQLRIELLSIGVVDIAVVDPESAASARKADRATRAATLQVYFPECGDAAGLVNLRISSRLTAKYVERALVVSDAVAATRPRTVALAIVEVLRASWPELVLPPEAGAARGASKDLGSRSAAHVTQQATAETDDPRPGARQAREVDAPRSALEQQARDERWSHKRLEWVAGGRLFPQGNAGDVSTTVSMSLALNRRLRLHVGGLAAGGGVSDKATDVHTFEAAGRVGLGLGAGSDPEVEVLPAVEIGWARLTSPNLPVLSRPLAIGSLHASIRTSMAKGVDAIVGLQTGYVLKPVERRASGLTLGGLVGPVIGVTVGLAGIL